MCNITPIVQININLQLNDDYTACEIKPNIIIDHSFFCGFNLKKILLGQRL